MLEGQHVDRCMVEDVLSSNLRVKLLGRYRSVDHPDIGSQERDGSALMVWLSEPHADADCPFGEGTVVEQLEKSATPVGKMWCGCGNSLEGEHARQVERCATCEFTDELKRPTR